MTGTTARLLVGTIALFVAPLTGCDEKVYPTEAELPPEAELAYPGAVAIDRSFDEGQTGTYISGESANRAPRLHVRYGIDGATKQQILDWYDSELRDLGWTLDEPETVPHTIGFDRAGDDDLLFQIAVTTGADPVTEYGVVLVLSYDD